MKPFYKAVVQGAVCGLVVGPILLIGAQVWRPRAADAQGGQPAPQEAVVAKAFILVDDAGKLRGTMSVVDGNAGLTLCDEQQREAAGLTVTPDRKARLSLYGPTGGLELAARDGPSLGLFDSAGKPRHILSLGDDGSPGFTFYNADGSPLLILSSTGLDFDDAEGKVSASLGILPKGVKAPWEFLGVEAELAKPWPVLILRAGRAHIVGAVAGETGMPVLGAADQKGKTVWTAPYPR